MLIGKEQNKTNTVFNQAVGISLSSFSVTRKPTHTDTMLNNIYIVLASKI